MKVSGSWQYVYRAVDQYGQVIDVFVSRKRDLKAARAFFATGDHRPWRPAEVTTDRAHALVRVIAELLPAALHDTTQYANNRVEADHGRLKARLRPMRGLKRDRTASVVSGAMPLSRTCGVDTTSSEGPTSPRLDSSRPTIDQCNRARQTETAEEHWPSSK